jgi:outer membrane receptor for ferric coprogen and ferric-rhodotorulic acid
VHGDLTAESALEKLLAGTHLKVIVYPGGAFLITHDRTAAKAGGNLSPVGAPSPTTTPATTAGERLDLVVVSGTAEGLVATRVETPLREIPQTLSVIPPELLAQQNDTDLAEALAHAPGIITVRTDSLDNVYYSRGFRITSFHIDGGAAVFDIYGGQELDSIPPVFPAVGMPDLSEFDHIEVLHGSDALFANNGNPGATVSLVRKHPLLTPGVNVSAWVGSWNNTRVEADATGPLAFEGALRARVDAEFSEHGYFYQKAHFRRERLFAVLDYDLSPESLLTVGGSYQWDDAVPVGNGLPRNTDGSDPHLPRHTAFTFDWDEYHSRTAEMYVQWRQQFASSWKLKVNVAAWDETLRSALGTFNSPIDPATERFTSPPEFVATPGPDSQHEFTSDVTLSGIQDWLGHREEWAIGADYTRAHARMDFDAYYPTGPLVTNILDYDSSIYADPRGRIQPLYRARISNVARHAGLFSSFRVYLRDDLSVSAGARLSGDRRDNAIVLTTDGQSGSAFTSLVNTDVITPYGGILYDINRLWSLYASYADIYHSNGLGGTGATLKPSHGVDIEAGLKAAAPDGSLNGSLVFYRIRQYDVPVWDGAIQPLDYYFENNSSSGIDAELNGHIQADWLISGGYSFNNNDGADGTPLSSATPRHLFKLWTSKQLPGDLHRWSAGGEIQAQSANSRSGLYCPNPSGYCSTETYYKATQRAYAVVNLRVGLQITPRWKAALSLNNVLDKVYYQTVGTPQAENWYGEPRNVLFRLDGSL